MDAAPLVILDLSLSIDAHLASQEAADERAVGGVTPGLIGLGEEVTWRATHFHVPFRMTSRTTALERPNRFVDEQVPGPFRRFHHEHEFHPSGPGTVMVDRISFDAPLGPIGRLAETAVLGAVPRTPHRRAWPVPQGGCRERRPDDTRSMRSVHIGVLVIAVGGRAVLLVAGQILAARCP